MSVCRALASAPEVLQRCTSLLHPRQRDTRSVSCFAKFQEKVPGNVCKSQKQVKSSIGHQGRPTTFDSKVRVCAVLVHKGHCSCMVLVVCSVLSWCIGCVM